MARTFPLDRRRTGLALALSAAALAALLVAPFGGDQANAGSKIDADLVAQLKQDPDTPFWVRFDGQAALQAATAVPARDARGRAVLETLQTSAQTKQKEAVAAIEAAGATAHSFWASNTVYVTGGSPELATQLAELGTVARLQSDHKYELPDKETPVLQAAGTKAGPTTVDAADGDEPVEWGLADIGADDVWKDYGATGEGVVIGSIDSGAQYDHPALTASYRGTRADGTYDHNYNWYDPSLVCGSPSLAPCDNAGHGTHTIGTMTGAAGSGSRIGVAPGAKWIAAKGCESNSCSEFALLAAAQWMLAPTDLNGQNPRPELRPDIINNSWGNDNGLTVEPWYQDAVNAWIAAGIFPVFANGNNGPSCDTAGSPGDYTMSYAVGAYDVRHAIADFSSRGRGEDGGVKPDIAAPGVNIRSSYPGNTYALMSGTSMAAPHTAGTVALLWSAAPRLAGDVAATRALLGKTAIDTDDTSCGGTSSYNNVWGEGRLDALAAVGDAPRENTGLLAGTITDAATGKPVSGASLHITGALQRDLVSGPDGTYQVRLTAGTYTVTASAYGYTEAQRSVTVTTDESVTADLRLTKAPSATIHGTVTDGSGHGWPLYAKITATGVSQAGPWFTDPKTGAYEITLPAKSAYTLHVSAVSKGYEATDAEVDFTRDGSRDLNLTVDGQRCVAPGYSVDGLFETFDTTEAPAGWKVVNHTDGGGWEFDDPGPRGNRTPGGEGNFASVDSEFYGYEKSQDTELISPSVDLAGVEKPQLVFQSDLQSPGWTNSTATIDVSVDGGDWSTIWTHRKSNVIAPVTVALPQAAGHSDVRVRFRFQAAYDQWWEIDDVLIGDAACRPVDGGLVVGQVHDGNTDGPLAAATVTTGADTAISAATTEDPRTGDGFYTLFSRATGTRELTAAHDRYTQSVSRVEVVRDRVASADFTLDAGMLQTSTTRIDTQVRAGTSGSAKVTVSNTGRAPLTLHPALAETGSPAAHPGTAGATTDGKATGVTVPRTRDTDDRAAIPTTGGAFTASTNPFAAIPSVDEQTTASAGGEGWQTLAPYPTNIMDPALAVLDGKIYASGGFTGAGTTSDAYVYDPVARTWTPTAKPRIARQDGQAAALGGKIYLTGGWADAGTVVPATEVYDPAKNTWTQVATAPKGYGGAAHAVLGGKLYLVGGCAANNGTLSGDCGRTDVYVYDPTDDRWSTAAAYPELVSWASCGAIGGRLYCAGGMDTKSFTVHASGYVYDPATDHWSPIAAMPKGAWGSSYSTGGGKFLISGGMAVGIVSGIPETAGYAYDPATNSWSSIPDAKYPLYRSGSVCGFTVVGGAGAGWPGMARAQTLPGYADCGAGGVTWASVEQDRLTLAPGENATLIVHLDDHGLTDPGTYSADLQLLTDTPYATRPVTLTNTAGAPPTWASVKVTVRTQTCSGDRNPLAGAYLEIGGATVDLARRTGPDGTVTVPVPAAGGTQITVIASKDGWSSDATQVTVTSGGSAAAVLTLTPAGGCANR